MISLAGQVKAGFSTASHGLGIPERVFRRIWANSGLEIMITAFLLADMGPRGTNPDPYPLHCKHRANSYDELIFFQVVDI
jgi:hypothetical protein